MTERPHKNEELKGLVFLDAMFLPRKCGLMIFNSPTPSTIDLMVEGVGPVTSQATFADKIFCNIIDVTILLVR